MDRIEIQGLQVECIIGVRPHERHRPQRVVVDAELGVELANAGRSGRLADTCDYDVVAQQVTELIRFRRYELMETAAEELCAMLFAVQPAVGQVALRITKPAALVHRARGAAVRLERHRDAYPPRPAELAGTCLHQWLETHQVRLYTVTIHANQPFEPPPEWLAAKHEAWLIAGRVQHRERSLAAASELVRFGRLGPMLSDTGAELFVCIGARQTPQFL